MNSPLRARHVLANQSQELAKEGHMEVHNGPLLRTHPVAPTNKYLERFASTTRTIEPFYWSSFLFHRHWGKNIEFTTNGF